jgi:hypothetical protein
MMADTEEELHEMAARLGLKRAWFQEPPKASVPHYDLTPSRRALAIRYGAVFKSAKDQARERLEAKKNRNNFPQETGIYLVVAFPGDPDTREIEVYEHPINGLCCFVEDYVGRHAEVDLVEGCHVPVANTGLVFQGRIRPSG